MKYYKLFAISIMFLLLSVTLLQAQSYKDVAIERADKIVPALGIADAKKAVRVRDYIADQYINLNKIHTERDNQIKGVEGDANSKTKIESFKKNADSDIRKLHTAYLKKLSKDLNSAQIEKVKDGMTYNVVPLTFANYLLQNPYLSTQQQEKILAFLIEARELAMDGGSSQEKHAWFGKYKGKITNFLAAEGYDMKKESADWAKRRDTTAQTIAITQAANVVAALNLNDKAKRESVRNLVAHQYQRLEEIQNARTAKLAAIDKQQIAKEEKDKAITDAWADAKQKFDNQRSIYLAKLSEYISSEQIEAVKDEMTAHGLQKEYTKFQALLPNITEVQKKKVYDYLIEARENAMNVLTSKDRNQWFAKYRGRANNYLSAEGYNLRKATEELEKHTNNTIK
jgi:hypothetical protein